MQADVPFSQRRWLNLDISAWLRSGRWKYLMPGTWSGSTTMFDLEADPGEKRDLSRVQPERVEQLEARLQELIR